MDDAIDEMQDTARAIDVYELDSFTPEMKQMVALIVEAAGLTPKRCRCCATSAATARGSTS